MSQKFIQRIIIIYFCSVNMGISSPGLNGNFWFWHFTFLVLHTYFISALYKICVLIILTWKTKSMSYASFLVSTSALSPVGCWEPRMSAPAGEGAYPAVPPLPVPASARKLQAAVWVWQPAGGSQLWPQHGDLCRTQEQLGRQLSVQNVKALPSFNPCPTCFACCPIVVLLCHRETSR